MTIAVDITTGTVVGQVIERLPWSNHPEPATSGRVLYFCATGYHSVPASSVRIETV